jgi:hypothetical protein
MRINLHCKQQHLASQHATNSTAFGILLFLLLTSVLPAPSVESKSSLKASSSIGVQLQPLTQLTRAMPWEP